jgi:hypothetical protein
MLDTLGSLYEQRGREYPVVGVVFDNCRVADLGVPSGFAGKVGFTSIRTFVYSHSNGMMSEVTFAKAIPFTLNPPKQ